MSQTLALIWLYILVAGAPSSAIRARVVATLVLAADLLGSQVSSLTSINLLRHKGSFCATVVEESEIEVRLLKQLDGRVLITCLRAIRAFSEFVPRAKLS
jgi:hypothetical protein